jgi:hypothetical protein
MNENRKFIIIDGEYVEYYGEVEAAKETKTLFENYAYSKDGSCYIYGGKIKDDNILKPGYFYKGKDKFVYVPALDSESNKIDNIVDITRIKNELVNRQNFKDSIEEIDISDLRVFAPPIHENDDPLKKIIKQALIELQIDMREYSSKFDKDYDMSNLKGSITKPSPLSMKYFMRWCEILELDFNFTIKSKSKHVRHHLEKPITFSVE